MKRLITSVMLILCLIMVSSCSGALKEVTDYTGNITGTVMCDGEPLSAVEVGINPGGSTVFTNNYGTFAFNRIDAATYTLNFTKDGYKSAIKTVVVKAGETATADVSMEIAGNLIATDVDVLDFGVKQSELSLKIQNKSNKLVSWDVEKSKLPAWLSLSSYADDIPAKGINSLSVSVDRSKIEGESAQASINFSISSGQTLVVKVTVLAGVVGTMTKPTLVENNYNYFVVEYKPAENVSRFITFHDISSKLSEDTIISKGSSYELNQSIKIRYSVVAGYSGRNWSVYVIPFNELGQRGKMQRWGVDVPADPANNKTSLKDITSEGNYYVTGVRVLARRGKSMIISDDLGLSLFYAYYDSGNQVPNAGDVIEINGGDVVKNNGILVFKNPPFSTTGSFDLKGSDMKDAESFWETYSIASTQDLQKYGTSPNGVIPVMVNGILTSESNGSKFNLAVGYGDAKDPKASLVPEDRTELQKNDGFYVSCTGYAVGVNNGSVQILASEIKQNVTPIDFYEGIWDAEAYNATTKKINKWDGMEIKSFEDDGETWVYAETWMQTGQSYFKAYGRYNPKTGWIDMLGDYYDTKKTFYFTSDPSISYYSVFYPVSSGEGGSYLIGEGRDSESIAVFKPSLTQSNALILTGDYIPDESGKVANGFVFQYFQIDDPSNYGYFNVYTNLTLTRSTKSTNSSVKPNSIPFTLKKDIQKRYDVKIPYKRIVDSAISINGDSSKL